MKKFILKYIAANFQQIRIAIFRCLSDNNKITGSPKINQPALFLGKGTIVFGKKVQIGYYPSPYYYSGNAHFEARTNEAIISIGDNVYFNNNFVIIADTSVKLGNNLLIGTNVEIYDSDFHNIDPDLRFGGHPCSSKEVIIEDNVWLGSNVKILKGVTIGRNSVISNGAIVTKNIPPNVIAAGVPAITIKKIGNEQ